MQKEVVSTVNKKEKIPYRVIGTIAAKVWMLIGILICSGLLAFTIDAAKMMYENGVFYIGYAEKNIIYNRISSIGWMDANDILQWYVEGYTSDIEYKVENSNIMFVSISKADLGDNIVYEEDGSIYYDSPIYEEEWSYGDTGTKSTFYTFQSFFWQYDEDGNEIEYLSYIVIDPDMEYSDDYASTVWIMQLLCKVRYGIFVLGVALGIAIIFLFVELMIATGHSSGTEAVHPAFDAKCPFDVLTAIMIAGWGVFSWAIGYTTSYSYTLRFALLLICTVILIILWCMSFASRIKNHDLGKSLLITKAAILIWKLLKYVPLVWKLTLAGIVITALNIFLIFWMASGRLYGFWVERDIAFCVWLVLTILEFFTLIYIGVMLKRLQKAASEMAEGKSDTVVNDNRMLPVFKEHARNLKRIQEGMNTAMEKKMSSEKMQAQLITNVSHDIKTPLTSIINYSDLICKEKTDNEKITEYAEVLGRQSKKLKRLLEDIVEASKASSGNLEVHCVPCTAGTLVSQAAGEYEERLEESGLSLVIKNAESNIKIMADPRRMWRVFDNLLGNICKYAQPNTRVYLSIEEDEEKCYIVFKNTSAQELDINPDELMERFVRGDKSRNTEGNGLGMSIANNMISLQGGLMRVRIDGDLFKVILEFPKYVEENSKIKENN